MIEGWMKDERKIYGLDTAQVRLRYGGDTTLGLPTLAANLITYQTNC
jgi:hypothetical protein